MFIDMRARMATMNIRMQKKMHRKPIIEEQRMWRIDVIVSSAWEPAMSTSERARMAPV
jgi:hypothetical protein